MILNFIKASSRNSFLILLTFTVLIMSCTNRTEKEIETENNRQQLERLLDSITYKSNYTYHLAEKTNKLATKAILYAKNIPDSVALCRMLVIKGACFINSYQLDSTFIYAHRALEIAEILHNDSLVARSKNLIGVFYSYTYNFVKAATYYADVLQIINKSGNVIMEAVIINNLGAIYQNIGEDNLSINYYHRALAIYDSIHDEYRAAQSCSNLVGAYNAIGDTLNARKYCKKAFDILANSKDTTVLLSLLGNQSVFYDIIGEADSMVQNYILLLKYSKKLGNKNVYCKALSGLGVAYASPPLTNLVKAKQHIEKSLEISQEINNLNVQAENYHALSKIADDEGHFKKGNELFKKYVQIRDSIEGGMIKHKVLTVDMENKLKEQEYEARLLQVKLEIKSIQNTILIISLLIFFLIILLIRISYVNLKKSNIIKDIEKKQLKEQIEKDNKINELEKQKLDAEIEAREKELVSFSLKLTTKNDLLNKISKLAEKYYNNLALDKLFFNELTNIIKENSNAEQEWDQFKVLFEKVHYGFFTQLKQDHPSLTEHELRFCAYVKVNLRPKEIARVFNISPNTVKSLRYRVKKKLNTSISIEDFLRNI